MKIKQGKVIRIASGIFEGYSRAGPFVASREFDLVALIETLKPPRDYVQTLVVYSLSCLFGEPTQLLRHRNRPNPLA